MKKLMFTSVLICAACSLRPSETIPNPDCSNITRFEIIQVGKNLTLAEALFVTTGGWRKLDVFLYNEDLKLWSGNRYDGEILRVGLTEPVCAIIDGTHTYTTVLGANKTLQKVKIVNSAIPNPRYEIWKAEQEQEGK